MGKYIFDTSVLIDSFIKYYRIKNFPTFWSEFLSRVLNNIDNFCFIDKVFDEIKHMKNSDLTDWIKNSKIPIVSTDNIQFVDEYKIVLKTVESINKYSESSISKWNNNIVADPWLIAVANSKKYTIVTSEVPANVNSQHKALKIPDIADELKIECISMQQFITLENFVI